VAEDYNCIRCLHYVNGYLFGSGGAMITTKHTKNHVLEQKKIGKVLKEINGDNYD